MLVILPPEAEGALPFCNVCSQVFEALKIQKISTLLQKRLVLERQTGRQ